jgi:hypothetical protein
MVWLRRKRSVRREGKDHRGVLLVGIEHGYVPTQGSRCPGAGAFRELMGRELTWRLGGSGEGSEPPWPLLDDDGSALAPSRHPRMVHFPAGGQGVKLLVVVDLTVPQGSRCDRFLFPAAARCSPFRVWATRKGEGGLPGMPGEETPAAGSRRRRQVRWSRRARPQPLGLFPS